ncbi:DNA mismatch repair protein MutS [Ornithobacterium rhinotracheale]|uniref:DNA mismatch repair protein MutS n=1 Tax=Ornithobacterium rhinotracheale (strain ATCC 51463 / DSM 15997 / CCUG 23171 / CIP 104009 / LMG 9086) TaxID=867902 RepID=I3ZYF6_ORNRL|nr:DNA mismatch repair protein MutS [Ornithobacterium rhinotracheale]AFL96740.1 DNA mismatch repair protein MutS [Ornithobacterium rhinotracheale DSM 15997]AIP99478.1 DNA mismatch repair protein MutS [Ornithobacterium rhinotracheale ORT-UMN 88]KGB66499.1 DNA mismatch repair protein MutS [Ornithobacterium rhinotracheale H06-030791]MBN3662486.1 DNA mismatch repair protein MutS [Ornithobacterium rhinotracheale]MCK0194088.1 DNA mismatch repair protein MutS [Ornithobacterium rhinotracheale]
MAKKDTKETPLMQQYNKIKGKYPDAILLFRIGDFYETFGEDAIKTAKTLDIVLTKKANGPDSQTELAGFPYHSIDTYLPKLVRAGYRVAVCDQLEDPSQAKKIVKRGVTELVTPGVALNDQVIGSSSNNFLLSIHQEKNLYGMALLDISTGEFFLQEGDEQAVLKLIQNFSPSEIIHQKRKKIDFLPHTISRFYLDDWAFQHEFAYEKLTRHFSTQSLKGFGVEDMPLAITAAGSVMAYLDETHHFDLKHINKLQRIANDNFMWLDSFTVRNLEIFNSPHPDSVTLLDILNHTLTPMGTRMLRRWLALPLSKVEPIVLRQNTVDYLLKHPEVSLPLAEELKNMPDIERLCAKIATGKITPKQLTQLTDALASVQNIVEILQDYDPTKLKATTFSWDTLPHLHQQLTEALTDDPPHFINKGNVIAEGVSQELDELRNILSHGKEYLENMKNREIENTGIPSLKINFNNVFGYFIEVRNTHKDKVPSDWIRKQTLVNSERYITEELKQYEEKILGAEEKILQIETQLFQELIAAIMPLIPKLQENANALARLDCLLNFAHLAQKNYYVKPSLSTNTHLHIDEGRHPVIEQQLPPSSPYISNSVYLDDKDQQIMMITGPNMSGKSALLRQVALIVLMAQIGSYVPAKAADIGIVDRIFTRVGASDNLSMGESTFMVEMNETAQILNNLTPKSLILLDEIGRGTSTYDGISIAWSIAEFLHQSKFKPKTLFATHYHELNEMAKSFKRIKNYNVSIKETKDTILFLRKLQPGGSEHSFGIHVAKLAGMPQAVLNRAKEVLKQLENAHAGQGEKVKNIAAQEGVQLSFFQLDDPILVSIREEIEGTEIDTLTPVEALMKLNEIKKKLGK